MDDYLSDYDNVDQIQHNNGGIRYMPIKKKSVGTPDYQPLQKHNNSGKTLKHIQRNQKRMIAVIVVLSLLLLLVIIIGSTLVSVSWNKLNAKSEPNLFQNCKQESTSCVLSKWFIIEPNCTTEGIPLHTKVGHTLI
jgi:hypothetical protein